MTSFLPACDRVNKFSAFGNTLDIMRQRRSARMDHRERPSGKPRRKGRPAMAAGSSQDTGWKEILERYLPRFLEFYFPDIYRDTDPERYSFLDKELQSITKDSTLGRRYADKLIRVFLRDGSEQWLLIHIEVQGEAEEEFEKRLFIYNYRIFDRYDRDVVTLAVLSDSSETFRPGCFEVVRWVIALPEELEEAFHDDIRRFEEENKMAYVSTAEKIGIRKGKIEGKKEDARNMKQEGIDVEVIMRVTGLSREEVEGL
jgi:hypothetical protein